MKCIYHMTKTLQAFMSQNKKLNGPYSLFPLTAVTWEPISVVFPVRAQGTDPLQRVRKGQGAAKLGTALR